MSVIRLSANHVYAVAIGVAKLLNNVPAVNYVFLKDNTRACLYFSCFCSALAFWKLLAFISIRINPS